MRYHPGSLPQATGCHVIMAIGSLYLVVGTIRGASVVAAGARLPGQLLNLALVSVPSLALIYGGYQLRRTDIQPDMYPRVAGWNLLGGGVMVITILIVEITPGSGIENLGLAVLLFGALGSVGGFGIGFQQAVAFTRAREAEQQAARLDSFAGTLAHELRNPLQIAQLYLQQAVEGDDQATNQVNQALTRIEEMIDILLVTARGTASNIDREPVALADVAHQAWSEVSTETAELEIETDDIVQADPIHLRHLFQNLFENAVEHGGSDVTVRVGDVDHGEGFYVADDGQGIPTADRDKIFDVGYTTRPDGTGLGLTIVGQLAEAYDWDYTVTDSKGDGARFEFTSVDTVPSTKQQPNKYHRR